MATKKLKKNNKTHSNSTELVPKCNDEAQAAFDRIEPELATVTDPARIMTDIPRAVFVVLEAVPNLVALRPEIVKLLPHFPLAMLDKLEDYALGALYADAVASSAAGPVPALLAEGMPLREKLLYTAEAHVLFGDFDAQQVADIRAGTGYTDAATDLIALGSLYRDAWPRIGHRTPVSRADVDRAAELGTELVRALAANGGRIDVASDRRVRAYTLLLRAYEECQRAVEYVRWHEGDADSIAPTLFVKARRTPDAQANADGPAPEPAPAPPAPAPAPEPVPNGATS